MSADPEIARLREALREIAAHEECVCEGGVFDRFCTVCAARAALDGEVSRKAMRAAREFFDAATEWADLREKGGPSDKREQHAWDRLYALSKAAAVVGD